MRRPDAVRAKSSRQSGRCRTAMPWAWTAMQRAPTLPTPAT